VCDIFSYSLLGRIFIHVLHAFDDRPVRSFDYFSDMHAENLYKVYTMFIVYTKFSNVIVCTLYALSPVWTVP